MSALPHTLLFGAAFLAVFWEAAFPFIRVLFGAQISLLPPLMVYAALSMGLSTVAVLAVVSGVLFDSLSANPLGISILPLFAIGLLIYARRDLILRDQPFAQFVLGLVASAATPGLIVVLLLTAGQTPLLGWGSLWQWLVMSVGGATATPILFALFGWANRVLGYRRVIENSFRPDREIRRGK
ncbi:MAG: hypothetical protein IH623_15920 [Verrucomicrobia bacterium]|nr:hypothetical protein [Verrucomicrobiota bacterium]